MACVFMPTTLLLNAFVQPCSVVLICASTGLLLLLLAVMSRYRRHALQRHARKRIENEHPPDER